MKKLFLLILFFMPFFVWTESRVIKNADGDFVYKTTFSHLYANKLWEEVRIQNNSSFTLSRITCTIQINNKKHNLVTIQKMRPGSQEEFDGYEDDEMKDELPYYFGEAGKFTKNNKNDISFTINFKEHRDDIVITDVYERDKSLCFIINDSPDVEIKTEKDALKESGATTIVVEGKTYLLYNGVAYPVN